MAKQIEERPKIIVKESLPRNKERIRMKPGRLERMTHHVALQVQQIDCGVFKEAIPVPRRRAEIPEVRHYKKQDPENKECCIGLY